MSLILFVCRGNTCRSPMAEVAARAAATRSGADGITFASAGIEPAVIGGPADPRAVACVGAAGLDLTKHKTRAADTELLSRADRIFALDRGILDHLLAAAPVGLHPRISLLMALAPELSVVDVGDPWAGGPADYAAAYQLIDSAISNLTRG